VKVAAAFDAVRSLLKTTVLGTVNSRFVRGSDPSSDPQSLRSSDPHMNFLPTHACTADPGSALMPVGHPVYLLAARLNPLPEAARPVGPLRPNCSRPGSSDRPPWSRILRSV